MAPLDDLNGDTVLAEFESIIRGSGHIDPGHYLTPDSRGLVPERRAVNWVNALAAIAREIEERQGARRAEMLLRTIGSRMSRDLLTPLPAAREEFEPAINRALSILDWGWVAVLDRQDTIVFEHRAPWPFEKRAEQLRFVLEGFYTEILQRLADNETMQVRLTGKRGGAMVLKWLPADAVVEQPEAAPAPSVIVPAAPSNPAEGATAAAVPAAEPLILKTRIVPVPKPRPEDDRRLPPLTDLAASRRSKTPQPTMAAAAFTARSAAVKSSIGSMPILLVAATVFIALFALGMMTSTGDIMGGLLHRLSSAAGTRGSATTPMLSSLENRARQGDADAQIRLGLQLADSGAGADYTDAAHWFQAAAKSGSTEAQYDFAVMTAEGLGVKRDPVEAAILFMNAATGGFPLAEYRLGAAYQRGAGVKRNSASAAMWYERAARHGIRQAQFALAGLYGAGDGVKADPVVAYAWYRLAEENGDRDATAKRVGLYRDMSMQERSAARAQSAALINDVNSGRNLMQAPAHPTIDRLIASIS